MTFLLKFLPLTLCCMLSAQVANVVVIGSFRTQYADYPFLQQGKVLAPLVDAGFSIGGYTPHSQWAGCYASAVTVVNGHAWVVGSTVDTYGRSFPTFWRDGMPICLNGSPGYLSSIKVSGDGSIYFGGMVENNDSTLVAAVWKNMNRVWFSDSGRLSGITGLDIDASNNLWAVGYDNDVPGNPRPLSISCTSAVWPPTFISRSRFGANFTFNTCTGVAHDGNDVYISTSDAMHEGRLYKNGAQVLAILGQIKAVAAKDQNSYAVGLSENTSHATLWTNGVETTLPSPTELSGMTFATGIVLDGSDIYICGWGYVSGDTGPYMGIVWKNGVPSLYEHPFGWNVQLNGIALDIR